MVLVEADDVCKAPHLRPRVGRQILVQAGLELIEQHFQFGLAQMRQLAESNRVNDLRPCGFKLSYGVLYDGVGPFMGTEVVAGHAQSGVPQTVGVEARAVVRHGAARTRLRHGVAGVVAR
jgi:hypothetical protein